MKAKYERDNNYTTKILLEASNFSISLRTYDMYKKEVDQSLFYTLTKEQDNTITVKRIGSDAPGRIFTHIDAKCTCREYVSYMRQCRHTVCIKQSFDVSDFDICHHFRDSSGVFINENMECMSDSFSLKMDDSSQIIVGKTTDNYQYFRLDEPKEIYTAILIINSHSTKIIK